MTEETLLELAPLAALGVLEGAVEAAFAVESAASAAVRRELETFERVVGRIGLASDPVAPAPAVRDRLLQAASGPRPASRLDAPAGPPSKAQSSSRQVLALWLPLAAVLALALGGLLLRSQREEARREAARARAEAETLTQLNRDLQGRLDLTQRRLEAAEAFRAFVAHPATRVASLAGLPAAPGAKGRVLWNPERGEAFLFAAGLPVAPAGKAYEVWIIAGGAPVAAGLFRVESGATTTTHTLPPLDEVRQARTFAVTVEPETGVKAPTGPMILAGPAL